MKLNLLFIVGLGLLINVLVAQHHSGMIHNFGLLGPDSYELMARVKASVAAGHLVYLVPGDNGDQRIPLFWSHCLDVWIIVSAAPIALLVGWPRALYFSGAMLGPESLIFLGVAAVFASRALAGVARLRFPPGMFVLSAPLLLGYSLFACVNHRVLLVGLALWVGTLSLLALRTEGGSHRASIAGALCALGNWLSPEFVPFALLAWAALLLGDAREMGHPAARSFWFSLIFTVGLTVIVAVDPPFRGYFTAELDRVSIAYVELGILMVLSGLAAGRAPVMNDQWARALVAAVPAILAVGIWALTHSVVFGGIIPVVATPTAVRFLDAEYEWQQGASFPNLVLYVAIPALILAVGSVRLLQRRIDPVAVFAVGVAFWLVLFGVSHVRFATYLEAAGMVVAPVLLERAVLQAQAHRFNRRIAGVIITALLIVIVPLAGGRALSATTFMGRRQSCKPRLATAAFNKTTPHVVLAPISDGPAIVYFSHATVVTGPYTSRAGSRIGAALAAFGDTNFDGRQVPRSVRLTGATYIVVCTLDPAPLRTLYGTLAHGRPPPWAIAQPISRKSGYKLFRIKQ